MKGPLLGFVVGPEAPPPELGRVPLTCRPVSQSPRGRQSAGILWLTPQSLAEIHLLRHQAVQRLVT